MTDSRDIKPTLTNNVTTPPNPTKPKIRLPELLAPAGGEEQLIAAVRFGADAVYVGLDRYGLRASATNFSKSALKKAVDYVHRHGRRIYVTLNIFAYDDDLDGILESAHDIAYARADAAIVTDPGVIALLREHVPSLELHLSTQANTLNHAAANLWHRLGIRRVVLARELSMERIRALRDKIHPELEIETFVHGAMCMSFSGRCILSNYITGRDGNRGACTQPCRWEYALTEEKRPGVYFQIEEDERGTTILSAGDLCMLDHIPELCEAGISGLKIEGRMKNALYVATVVNAYRCALDEYATSIERSEEYRTNMKWMNELEQLSHRRYDTGFYYGKPNIASSGTTQLKEFVAIVLEYDYEKKTATVELRNRFFVGDKLEIITPKGILPYTVEEMRLKKNDVLVESHGVPKDLICLPISFPVEPGDIFRRSSYKK